MAAGDASEIAEAACSKTEKLIRIWPLGEVMDQGEGQQVGQVADRCENAVMFVRGELGHLCAAKLPGHAHRLDVIGRILRQWCQHHALIDIESGLSRRHTALFRTGYRMAGYELPHFVTERCAGRRNNVGLGAAAVGDDRMWLQMRRQRFHHRRHLAHRHAEQDQIGPVERRRPVGCDYIDHPKPQRLLQWSARTSHADDLQIAPQRQRRLLQGQRERTADQPDTADDNLALRHQSDFSRASRNMRFSVSRPMVTRRWLGKP
jgi:hypothetical protein